MDCVGYDYEYEPSDGIYIMLTQDVTVNRFTDILAAGTALGLVGEWESLVNYQQTSEDASRLGQVREEYSKTVTAVTLHYLQQL